MELEKRFLNRLEDSDIVLNSEFYYNENLLVSGSYTYDLNAYNNSEKYYLEVLTDRDVLFKIGYGNYFGEGTPNNQVYHKNNSVTKAVYSALRNLLIYPFEEKFSFKNSVNEKFFEDEIFVLIFSRKFYKEKLNLCEFILPIGNEYLTDNSLLISDVIEREKMFKYNIVKAVFDINTQKFIPSSNYPTYGYFYPTFGIIVLSVTLLRTIPGVNQYLPLLGTHSDFNIHFFELLKNTTFTNANLKIQNEIDGRFNSYFIRIRNKEFNFTNNPTFRMKNGKFYFQEFYLNPKTYITGIGLYNDQNELLAYAKLSRPIPKNYDTEYLIRVDLNKHT